MCQGLVKYIQNALHAHAIVRLRFITQQCVGVVSKWATHTEATRLEKWPVDLLPLYLFQPERVNEKGGSIVCLCLSVLLLNVGYEPLLP
jgi:hypothetical protein